MKAKITFKNGAEERIIESDKWTKEAVDELRSGHCPTSHCGICPLDVVDVACSNIVLYWIKNVEMIPETIFSKPEQEKMELVNSPNIVKAMLECLKNGTIKENDKPTFSYVYYYGEVLIQAMDPAAVIILKHCRRFIKDGCIIGENN